MKVTALRGRRWRFVLEDPGAVKQRLVAEATDELSATHAELVGHLLSDDLGRRILVVSPGKREPNPKTLVHGAYAQAALYHVLSGRGAPLADLYVGEKLARRVGRMFADVWGEPVRLYTHRPGFELEGEHERRVPGSQPNPARSKLKRIQRRDVRTRTSRKFRRALHGATARERAGAAPAAAGYARARWYQERSEARRQRNPVRARDSRGRFLHRRVRGAGRLDQRSLRTIRRGVRRIVVGCPQGHYHPRARGPVKCDVGTRAQAVLTPKRCRKNPAPAPVAGQLWRCPLGHVVEVLTVGPSRIVAKDRSTGNRLYLSRSEFLATYKPPAGRRTPNPRRSLHAARARCQDLRGVA